MFFYYILKAVFENLLIIFLCFYEFFNYLVKSIDCNRHLILPNQQKVAFYLLSHSEGLAGWVTLRIQKRL